MAFEWLFGSRCNNKIGRLTVEEYVHKIKQIHHKEVVDKTMKEVFRPEILNILLSCREDLASKGVDVTLKDIVDNVYILSIEPTTWLPEVSLFKYKGREYHISKDGVIYWQSGSLVLPFILSDEKSYEIQLNNSIATDVAAAQP